LDLLEELRARGVVSQADWMGARHKLRIGGVAIVPVDASEVTHAANRSRAATSAEMRAIQESIDLACVAEVPSFPREMQWFASISMAIKSAVIQIWKTEKDFALAGRLSNLIMSVVPKPEDWVGRWEGGPPPEWVEGVNQIIVASLTLPVELDDEETETAYNAWLERNHLEPLRSVWPGRYRAVVEHVRAFLLGAEDENDEEEKKIKPARNAPKKGKSKPRPKPEAGQKAKSKEQAQRQILIFRDFGPFLL